MDWILALLLFLHVGGAILAFGPLYAFQILGPMARSEPGHLNFAIRFQRRVGSRLVMPLAVFQGVTGLLLVWRIGFDLLQRGWLLLAIVLYVIALAIAFIVVLPTSKRLDELTSAPPAAGSAGPPPELPALAQRARMASIANAALVLIIVFLMVTKPF